ncbi:MAG: hypothetical protein ACFB21_05105 [Opitutales bacterium]
MLLAQSGVRDDQAGPTGPAVAIASLFSIEMGTPVSGRFVRGL